MNFNKMLLQLSTMSKTLIRRNQNSCTKLVEAMIDDKSGVATVIMKNPPVNIMSTRFLDSMIDTFDELEKSTIRGIILTSDINHVFSAGLDINEFCNPDKERLADYCFKFEECWSRLYSCPFTTIAAINGHAPAGGCLLTLTTEYRIMKDNYRIGLNEVDVGLVAPPWLMENMASVMSRRNSEMALTLGTLFNTLEALEIGLVNELVADNTELMNRAEAVMQKYLKVNTQARGLTKSIYRQKYLKDFYKNRDNYRAMFMSNIMIPEIQDKIQNFMNNLKKKNSKE